ncbi:MAG: MarR family transcriptional regulator [Porphyrobacter sp.]|nr:MarR family transcriptional regulator [Porphyrobacter sp.]
MGAVDHPPDPARESRQLRSALRELAGRLARLEAKAGDGDAIAVPEFSDEKLATIASSLYRSRLLREKFFDGSLLAEPAWDMLLDLFISAVRGVRVATMSLCLAARVPQATGLRWIALLQKQALLRRYRAPEDARLRLIEITPLGFRLMRQYLTESVARFKLPLPD